MEITGYHICNFQKYHEYRLKVKVKVTQQVACHLPLPFLKILRNFSEGVTAHRMVYNRFVVSLMVLVLCQCQHSQGHIDNTIGFKCKSNCCLLLNNGTKHRTNARLFLEIFDIP